MPDLLACPFCGQIPDQPDCYRVPDGTGGKWGRVECGCGACGPDVRTGYYTTVDRWAADAAQEWNRRA
jgi:hypothetical protein